MTRILVLFALILGLASCGLVRNTAGRLGVGGGSAKRASVEAEGVRFRARASASREDRRSVTVTVTPFAVNPEASLEAGRYQATRYCLLTYGGSDTEWIIGPDAARDQLPVSDDTVTLQGRCTQP